MITQQAGERARERERERTWKQVRGERSIDTEESERSERGGCDPSNYRAKPCPFESGKFWRGDRSPWYAASYHGGVGPAPGHPARPRKFESWFTAELNQALLASRNHPVRAGTLTARLTRCNTKLAWASAQAVKLSGGLLRFGPWTRAQRGAVGRDSMVCFWSDLCQSDNCRCCILQLSSTGPSCKESQILTPIKAIKTTQNWHILQILYNPISAFGRLIRQLT